MPELVLRLHRQWPVKCPPCKKHVVKGKFIPTVKGAFGARRSMKRLVTIELYAMEDSNTPTTTTTTMEDSTPVVPATTKPTIPNLSKECKDDDRIIVRIMKPRKSWGLMKDHDDDDSDESSSSESQGDAFLGWMEYRRYDLDEIDQVECNKTSWEATVGRASNMERRELNFETEQEAMDFQQELENLRAVVKERAAARLAAFQQAQSTRESKMKADMATALEKKKAASIRLANQSTSSSSKAIQQQQQQQLEQEEDLLQDGQVNLLVEIVSATDLPIADVLSTDPYVVVFMGKQEVHRTKPISKTLNPIWTVDNGSLFNLCQPAEEFFASASGLTFYIKDYDGISSNETVGKVEIPQTDLLAMMGERAEFDIQVLGPFQSNSQYFKPKLMVRVRPAKIPNDVQFLKQLRAIQKSKKLGVYADQSFVAPVMEHTKLFKREQKVLGGVKVHRVKPRPDPSREEAETKWMSKEQINKEALKPSTRWIAAGSGTLGKLFLEVIKCDNLPNMDTGIDGLSDPYCCIIYEDAIVNTDVINDELSPRWPPWSQRAFVFSIQHPSSQLLLGVVDFDNETGPNTHDGIGRVTIDVTNYAPDTDYLLTFDLHASVLDEVRPKVGTVTVRLRIECESFRDYVKGSLAIPPLHYINLAKKSDFLTAYFVCCGEENLQKLDMQAMGSYKTELVEYLDLIYDVMDAIVTVVLWRGHYRFQAFGKTVLLPLHSMVAFWMATRLIDNFNYLPSFFFFCIAWFFLATNEQRQRNPSPWHQSQTFLSMWYALISDKQTPMRIADHEDEAACKKYNAKMAERKEKIKANKALAAESQGTLSNFLMEEEQAANSDAVEAIETQVHSGVSLNPFAPILLPIQKILGMVCVALRVVRSLVTWEESIYAFLIVNVCLALGFLLIWVPWGFFVRWTLRICIWVGLGPWMKLVDIYYVQKLNEEGDNRVKQFNRMAASKLVAVNAARTALMMQKEHAVKLKDMKRYMFGKYSTRRPQFKEYRYSDIPTPESKAIPRESVNGTVKIIAQKRGQNLEGPMIPTWGGAMDEEAGDKPITASETLPEAEKQ